MAPGWWILHQGCSAGAGHQPPGRKRAEKQGLDRRRRPEEFDAALCVVDAQPQYHGGRRRKHPSEVMPQGLAPDGAAQQADPHPEHHLQVGRRAVHRRLRSHPRASRGRHPNTPHSPGQPRRRVRHPGGRPRPCRRSRRDGGRQSAAGPPGTGLPALTKWRPCCRRRRTGTAPRAWHRERL
jgi:hypothetical protein